jgi:hypothetical protein
MPANRRFPPPWSIEDIGAAFVVKDSGGQKLGYFYYEEEPGRRSAAKLLAKDEARADRGQRRQAAGAVAEALERRSRRRDFTNRLCPKSQPLPVPASTILFGGRRKLPCFSHG